MAFVLVAQVPNLINQWSFTADADGPRLQQLIDAQNELHRACTDGKITLQNYEQQLEKLRADYDAKTEEIDHQKWEQVQRVTTLASLFVPPAWMPLGAMKAAKGKLWPVLLATLGMTLLGTVSLRRSYRTTLRLYTGQLNSGSPRPAVTASASPATPASTVTKTAAPTVGNWLEPEFSWLPEPAVAVALSSFRSLLRPGNQDAVPEPGVHAGSDGAGHDARWRASRACATVDRLRSHVVRAADADGNHGQPVRHRSQRLSGFHALRCESTRSCSARTWRRRRWRLGYALVVIGAMQILAPMRLDLLCRRAGGNDFDVSAVLLAGQYDDDPHADQRAGRLVAPARRPSGLTILVQLLAIFILYPLTVAPILLPMGMQMLTEHLGWNRQIPVCLLLSLVECAVVVYVYRLVLHWQGRLLQAREQAIYAVVRSKEE